MQVTQPDKTREDMFDAELAAGPAVPRRASQPRRPPSRVGRKVSAVLVMANSDSEALSKGRVR